MPKKRIAKTWKIVSLVLGAALASFNVEAAAQFPFGGRGGDDSEGNRGGGRFGGGPGAFLSRFDENEDGVIEPGEVPERAREMFERMAENAELDPSKPIAVRDLEAAMQRMREQWGRGRGDSRGRGRRGEPDSGDGNERRDGERREERSENTNGNSTPSVTGRGFGGVQPAARGFSQPGGSSKDNATATNRNSANDPKFAQAARQIFDRYDNNKDNLLQEEERSGYRWVNLKEADTNGDNLVSEQELASFLARRAGSSESADADSSTRSTSSVTSVSSPVQSARIVGSPLRSGQRSFRFLTARERLPEGLPSWFAQKDADADGQVMMVEWAAVWTDEQIDAFAAIDRNQDGIITPKEALASD